MKKIYDTYILDYTSRVYRVLKRAELDFNDLQGYKIYEQTEDLMHKVYNIPFVEFEYITEKYQAGISLMFKIYSWCKLYGIYAHEEALRNDIDLLSKQTKKHITIMLRRSRDYLHNLII